MGFGQGVALVGAFDLGFGVLGEDCGAGAVGGLAASPGAGEVLVAVSGFVVGAFDHEFGSAGAVQGAFEVVVVFLGVVRRVRCRSDALNPDRDSWVRMAMTRYLSTRGVAGSCGRFKGLPSCHRMLRSHALNQPVRSLQLGALGDCKCIAALSFAKLKVIKLNDVRVE